MAAGKEIKRLRGKKVSAVEAASLIGVGVDRLRKWEERDTDPSDTGDIQKVEEYFGRKLSELAGLEYFDFVQISREIDSTQGKDLSLRALVNLTESNKILAESNKSLARSHEELVQMVKPTVRAEQDNGIDDPSTLVPLVQILAGIASGKIKYRTEQEALAELGIRLSLHKPSRVKVKSTPSDAGK